jgi:hypothetical protein
MNGAIVKSNLEPCRGVYGNFMDIAYLTDEMRGALER